MATKTLTEKELEVALEKFKEADLNFKTWDASYEAIFNLLE